MATVYLTDKKIPLDERLWKKLQRFIKRCVQPKPKLDTHLNIDGEEGIGKTTFSALVGYVVSYYTGRPFSEKNCYFETDKAIKFAQETKEQIIIFDEPASDLLSSEWWNKEQQNLIKLLTMARKKRHFIIFNLARFYKFRDFIAYERPRGMVHLYCRAEEQQVRFMYIKKKYLERLYVDCKVKKMKNYGKYGKFSKCMGTLPDVFDANLPYNILDKFNYAWYDAEKDKAIMRVGQDAKQEAENDYQKLKFMVSHLKPPIKSKAELARQLGITDSTLHNWANRADTKLIRENALKNNPPNREINTIGIDNQDKQISGEEKEQ